MSKRIQGLRASMLVAGALGMAFLISSCGGTTEGRETVSSDLTNTAKTVEEALPRVKAMVDATAAVVAAGFHVEPDQGFEPTGCENAAGNDDGTLTAPYNLKFAIPDGTDIAALFDKARTYWSQHGYHVSEVNLKIFDPRMHATQGDYELVLHVVPSQRMAYLGGDTPCLSEAKK